MQKQPNITKVKLARLLRFIFIMLLCCFILVGAMAVCWYLLKTQKSVQKNIEVDIPLVTTTISESKSIQLEIHGYGRVRTGEVYRVQSRVNGRIIKLHEKFKVGEFIDKGEILVVLDPYEYEKQIKIAENELKMEKLKIANFEEESQHQLETLKVAIEHYQLTKETWERAKDLKHSKSMSLFELYQNQQGYIQRQLELIEVKKNIDGTKNSLEVAKSKVANTQIHLEDLHQKLAWTTIKAPFDSFIASIETEGIRTVDPTVVIAVLENVGIQEVVVPIAQEQIYKLFDNPESMNKLIRKEYNITAKIIVSIENKDYIWMGEVTRLHPMIESSGTIPIVVRVNNSKNSKAINPPLQNGTLVKVVLLGRKIENVHVISREWLRESNTVHVAQDGVLKINPVHIVHRMEEKLVIDQGLKSGEKIILSTLQLPIPGMKVHINEVSFSDD